MFLIEKWQFDKNHYLYEANTAQIFKSDKMTFDTIDDLLVMDKKSYVKRHKNSYKVDLLQKNYDDFNLIKKDIFKLVSTEHKNKVKKNTIEKVKNIRKKKGVPYILSLSVHGDCNLRCKYCIYGDNYSETRKYENKKLKVSDNLLLLIDKIYRTHKDKMAITFYGGEPLLGFETLKRVINYCNYKKYQVLFSITTNGVLLNDDKIVKFLVENHFRLNISVDVNKKIHDRNRVFSNGKGSYDIISSNINKIKKIYPEYYKNNIALLSVISDNNDWCEAVEQQKNSEMKFKLNSVSDPDMIYKNTDIADVARKDKTTRILSVIEDYIVNLIEYLKYWIDKNGNEEDYKLRPVLSHGGNELYTAMRIIHKRNVNPDVMRFSSCVAIGYDDFLFVDHKGDLYPCEKIDYALNIGNIHELGLNYKEAVIDDFLDSLVNFKMEYCYPCWAKNLCKICVAELVDKNGKINYNYNICNMEKESIISDLKIYCRVVEEIGEDNLTEILNKLTP